jgi:hypothetical protein
VPYQPIAGKPLRFPPGRVEVRLTPDHRRLYRRLYARYGTILGGLPVLREDRDFHGRPVRMTRAQLDSLNDAFEALEAAPVASPDVFGRQEEQRTALFKRLQFLS